MKLSRYNKPRYSVLIEISFSLKIAVLYEANGDRKKCEKRKLNTREMI